MKFDFLSLLESIVLGFVSFVYSIARSIYAIIRHPVRGPIRLHGKYRVPHHRQIGGVTFLYLGFFLTLYLVFESLDFTSIAVLDAVWDAIARLPAISEEQLWPMLAGSLIGTTIVDATIRLVMARRVRRRARRELLIAAAEYSLFLSVVPAGFIGWYLPMLNCAEFVLIRDLPTGVYVLPPLLVLAVVPAAVILRAGAAKRLTPKVGGMGTGNAASAALLAFGLALLLAASAYAAVGLSVAIAGTEICGGP